MTLFHYNCKTRVLNYLMLRELIENVSPMWAASRGTKVTFLARLLPDSSSYAAAARLPKTAGWRVRGGSLRTKHSISPIA